MDLCPCVTLTIRDKSHIIDYLRGMKTGKLPFLLENGVLQDSYSDKIQQSTLWHRCDAYPVGKVDIELSITKVTSPLVCSISSKYLWMATTTSHVQPCGVSHVYDTQRMTVIFVVPFQKFSIETQSVSCGFGGICSLVDGTQVSYFALVSSLCVRFVVLAKTEYS